MAEPVYLDYNATAPLRPEAVHRMLTLSDSPLNASSVHRFGREAKKHLEDARKIIADAISAWPNEIIFTGSGTEANATALRGTKAERILVSAIEHSSVLKTRADAGIIPVDANGIVDLDALDALLANGPSTLVSVMLANNETGVIQPVAAIAAICKKYNALLHTDAVQALGKIHIDFGTLGVDMMTLSGHKCGGPLGAAALVVRRDLPLTPLLAGGGQELGRRAGTENIPAISGFAAAIQSSDLKQALHLRSLHEAFEHKAESLGGVVFGKSVARLPNTSCIAMPGVGNEVQLMDFDLNGFAVSAGSACSSGRIEVSHVLTAMGIDKVLAASAIRVSSGWKTHEKDLILLTEAWVKTCCRLSKSAIKAAAGGTL